MKKKTKKNICGAVFLFCGIAFILIGIAFSWSSCREEHVKGVRTTAEITSIREIRRHNGSKGDYIEHEVYVRYYAEGRRIEAKLPFYNSGYRVGTKLEVYYLADDPYKVGVAGWYKPIMYISCGAGAVALICGIVLLRTPEDRINDLSDWRN